MVRPGEIFADKYRVERVLGEGGMGIVVAAHHIHLDERVALKFLRREIAHEHNAAERFLREARTATKVKSEHIARIFDVGTHDGVHYMVMEHLDGETLGTVLERTGPIPVPLAIEYVVQMCGALGEAHASGIVHRDLKPDNVFLTKRGNGTPCVKILDFGISKVIDDSAKRMTATSALMGSPLYMSPEQLVDPRGVDHRADIWAIGVLLYELVSGKHPFDAESIPQLCVLVRETPAPKLRDVCPSAPAELEAAILRCLEKDRAARFQSAGELAASLCRIRINSVSLRPARVGVSVAPPDEVDPAPSTPAVADADGARGPSKLLVTSVAACALLAVIGVGLAAAARFGPKKAPAGEASLSQTTSAAEMPASVPSTSTPMPPPAIVTAPPTDPASASAPVAKNEAAARPIKTATTAATRAPGSARPPVKPVLPLTPDDR
jgi:eukaryotic-like serine/threonine-protein kinase